MSPAANNRLSANDMYRWQKTAVNKLARSWSHLLAAQAGAGKTITALSALPEGRTLLVAPRQILSSAWVREAERWEHTHKLVFDLAHDLEPIPREWLIFEGTGDIVTVTPDMFPTVIEQIAEHGTIPFERIVIDESHLFNNPTGKRGSRLLWISERVPVWLLSGTPTPNGPIDSYVPGFVASNGGEFWKGGFKRWRNRNFEKASRFSWRPKKGAVGDIRKKLAKHGTAISLDGIESGVPEAVYLEHPFAWGDYHRQRIEHLFEHRVLRINPNDERVIDEDSFLSVARQVSSGFIYEDGDSRHLSPSRIDALQEVIAGTEGGVLVATHYKAEVAAIRARIPTARAYTGDTSPAEREQIIDDWNADKIRVLVCNPGAMGLGLNLQKGNARTVCWFSHGFSHSQRIQLNARLIRSGQRHVVSVISLIADIGIDRAALGALERKGNSEQALLSALRPELGFDL
ncbi:DEAD/DEAH box helicase [Luminiphilus sp.]|nr:DEAD/DEAH box helicase [Luminiphilus sp.]